MNILFTILIAVLAIELVLSIISLIVLGIVFLVYKIREKLLIRMINKSTLETREHSYNQSNFIFGENI